jgi:hypothetical protein
MVVNAYQLFSNGQLSSNPTCLDTNLVLVRRDSTQADQDLKPSPKPIEDKEIRVATKRRTTVPKRRSISAIRDFPPILGWFNPYLSGEQKRAMHTQLTQISDEYAQVELKKIRLLKIGALPEGSDCQRIAFLSSINKDYKALVKDKEDPSEDLTGVVIF